MRSWVAVPTVALACILLVPAAAAHLGAVETDPSEEVDRRAEMFSHIGCVPTCETQTSEDGYVSPVTVVESGSTVEWVILQGTLHSATSDVPSEDLPGMLVDGTPPFRPGVCMDTEIAQYDPGQATLRLQDGQLQVYEPKNAEAGWETCEEAIALPGGGFALSYHCSYHPRSQHGAIVVLSAS